MENRLQLVLSYWRPAGTGAVRTDMTRLAEILRFAVTTSDDAKQKEAFEAFGRRVWELAEGQEADFFDDPSMGYPAGKPVTLRACAQAMRSIAEEEGIALPE